jgi:DNA-binding transcriptional LysR family regulator
VALNLRQLACFVEVADQGSFTRAAAHLGMAQPSLSQQIRILEREVGVVLLERLPRGARMTPAGEAFLPEARMAVSSAARAARTARSVADVEAGDLEILAIMSVAVGMLPESVRRWHRRHPAVPIRLHEYIHVDALDEALRNGRGDIGIGPTLVGWSGPVVPLGWEEFHVVLPADDELQELRAIPIRRLADREWVLFDEDNSLSDVIALVCLRSGGFTPHGVVRTSQISAAANLAAAGLGATLIPSTIIPRELQATVRPLDPPVARQLAAHARSTWSPAATAYLELVTELPWETKPPPGAVRIVSDRRETRIDQTAQ